MNCHSRASLILLFPACAFLFACRNELAPRDDYVLPPADPSLDPAALVLGEPLYACGQWSAAGRPTDQRVLVDLFFGRREPSDPMDRPRQASLDAVRAAGGNALFQFAFPAARVRIDTDRIPGLVDSGVANYARTVPDARRYDWDVIVGFKRPSTNADSLMFVNLGGRVSYVFQSMSAIAGYLPNASIAAYRTHSDVQYVEAGGLGCLAGLGNAEPANVV